MHRNSGECDWSNGNQSYAYVRSGTVKYKQRSRHEGLSTRVAGRSFMALENRAG